MSNKKEKIIQVAAELFEEQGYHATGLAQILAEARAELADRVRALRGTALEYLDTVLPDNVFFPLLDRCGGEPETHAPKRPVEQVEADLDASKVLAIAEAYLSDGRTPEIPACPHLPPLSSVG